MFGLFSGLQSVGAEGALRLDARKRGSNPSKPGDLDPVFGEQGWASPDAQFDPWSPDAGLVALLKPEEPLENDGFPRAVALSPSQIAALTYAASDSAAAQSTLSAEAFALPAGTDAEITFLSGVTSAGRVAATSFATWNGDSPATYSGPAYVQKWGSSTIGTSGGTVSYWFDAASAWTATEKAAMTSCLSLWSAVANINFTQAASAAGAGFRFLRGTDGNAFATSSGTGATVGAASTGTITPGSAYISIDTSVPGFGPLGGTFDKYGGYPWGTLVHEIGHMLGLGHGGAYNGSVNPATQQFSAFDTLLWSTMSYISPTAITAKFYGSSPVTGTSWGYSSDFYGRTPTTPMMLDYPAIQRLYGASVGGPLSGGQTYGFNTNIAASVRNFFDFTVNNTPVITIWNGGVGNKLDASGFVTANTISLVDGTFSSLNGMRNNVGIAAGTIIESAVGGSGIDTFIGNAYNNVLRGNAGADVMNGAAGVDTAAYNVARAGAVITRNVTGTVTINSGVDGIDTLTDMEWAQFTDGKIWVGAQHGDINGDNRSDLFLQSAVGMPAIWQMNNGVFSSGATLPNPGSDWTLVGSGDFNGDRKADLLWQRISTGDLAQWQMNGSTILANPVLPSPGATWRLIGAGDFNGDSKSDMAWQRNNGELAIWTMDGGTIVNAAVLAANPGVAWHLHSAADFNADGTSDLLFQHDDGTIATWEMNGTTFLGGHVIGNPGAAWRIKGTGDFNKDGHADIVLQNSSGAVAVWLMQDAATALTNVTSGAVASPGAAWQVGSIGDYNGDGNSDMALQSSATGQVSIWSMNGANLTPSMATLAQNPGTSWHIVS